MLIGISACLLGVPCRYDGGKLTHPFIKELDRSSFIPFCPETLGGFSTPRLPCEFACGDGESLLTKQGKIINSKGVNITIEMIKGAEKALALCLEKGIKEIWLQEGSPSCGYSWIYDGTFTGKKKKGQGIFAAMAKAQGIHCVGLRGIKMKDKTIGTNKIRI